MGRLKGLSSLTCDLQGFGDWNRSGRKPIGERRAFDELQDQYGLPSISSTLWIAAMWG